MALTYDKWWATDYAFDPVDVEFGPLYFPSSGGAAGVVSVTEAANTAAATGTVAVTGAASVTEAADTTTAAGAVPVTGTASVTEAADLVTAGGSLMAVVDGVASATEAANTLSAAGAIPVVGVTSVTEAVDALSATGVAEPMAVGTAAITEAANTLTAAGTVAVNGAATTTNAVDTLAGAGVVLVTRTGAFAKTEAANTLTGVGLAISGYTLVAKSSTANRTFMRKLYKAGGNCLFPAPYIYVDSAGDALTNWPTSTAVSVGQKYSLQQTSNEVKYQYAEVTQAGTTSASLPTLTGVQYGMGYEVTSGTAKFRLRYFHGWDRARQNIINNMLPPDWGFSYSGGAWSWTIVMASTSTQTTYTGRCDLTNQFTDGKNYLQFPGSHVVSVNKAAFPPTTFAAGASLVVTGDNEAPTFTSSRSTGTVRGVALGHDNTTTTNYQDEFASIWPWATSVRWVDCTFTTYAPQTTGSTRRIGGHAGITRHSLRCTVRSLHGTTPVPVLVSNEVNLEAPTISRTNVSTSPLMNIDIDASTGNFYDIDKSLRLLGADLSALTSASNTWGYVSASGKTLVGGAPLHAFGTLFKSSAIPQPTTQSASIAWSAYNTTVIGEMNTGYQERPTRQIQSDYGGGWPAVPATQRNSTYTRSGGASDALGSYSYKCTVDTIVRYPYHFEFFNTKIDESFTITLEFEWSSTGTGLTTLKDEDVWLEAAFLSNANTDEAELVFSFDKYDRRGLIYNDATGPAALTTSASTWSGGLGSAVKQKVSVIVTPKKVGPIKVWLGTWLCPWTQNVASVSSLSIYVCPLPVLS